MNKYLAVYFIFFAILVIFLTWLGAIPSQVHTKVHYPHPAPISAHTGDPAQVLAKAAQWQTGAAIIQAAAAVLVLLLANRQIREMTEQRKEMKLQREQMEKDRAELVKGRQLGPMPFLTCNITDVVTGSVGESEAIEQLNYLILSNVSINNAGNAAALKTHTEINVLDQNDVVCDIGDNEADLHTILVEKETISRRRIIPHVPSSSEENPYTLPYKVSVVLRYENCYRQKYTTKAEFSVKPFIEHLSRRESSTRDYVVSKWSKISESFYIEGW